MKLNFYKIKKVPMNFPLNLLVYRLGRMTRVKFKYKNLKPELLSNLLYTSKDTGCESVCLWIVFVKIS